MLWIRILTGTLEYFIQLLTERWWFSSGAVLAWNNVWKITLGFPPPAKL
jgi:hypothetical protein